MIKKLITLFFITASLCLPVFAKKIDFSKHIEGNELNLFWQGITDDDIPQILDFLSEHPKITSLNLHGNFAITTKGLEKLAENKTLLSVRVEGLFIKDEGIIALAKNTTWTSLGIENADFHKLRLGLQALIDNQTLTALGITSDDPNDIALLANKKSLTKLEIMNVSTWETTDNSAIPAVFEKNENLTSLIMYNFNLGDGAKAFANNNHLIQLSLVADGVTNEGALALAKNSSIRKLSLSNNSGIKESGVIALAKNPVIEELGLSGIDISEEALSLLAKSSLSSLKINCWSCNHFIGDDGAIALSKNPYLTSLDIGHQNITAKGAIALANKTNLVDLRLDGNFIDDEGAVALSRSNSISTLDLSQNEKLSSVGMIAVASNQTLKRLDLSRNHVSTEVAIALANNTTLNFLDLYDTHISVAGLRALANNHSIECINIYGDCNDNDVDFKHIRYTRSFK